MYFNKHRDKWIVQFKRKGKTYRGMFNKDEREEAAAFEAYLLATLPPVARKGAKYVAKKTVYVPEIKMNGCTLIPAMIGRCSKFVECKYYEDCLEEVCKTPWPGWTTKEDQCAQLPV